jgi:hybrid cluster-associated redox disulfide protein
MSITKDMKILDVLKMDRNLANVFQLNGLMCPGCPSASKETLEDAAAIHGINLGKLINDLNERHQKH